MRTSVSLRAAAAAALIAPAASAQVVFSIDWKGPSIALPDSAGGAPITEADLLRAAPGMPSFGPLRPPAKALSGAQLGLQRYSQCLGHAPGIPCGIELDALSTGHDVRYGDAPAAGFAAAELWFSVDDWARGLSAPFTSTGHAAVDTESAVGDACADVFVPETPSAGPTPPPFPQHHSVGVIDGNGLRSNAGFVYVGLGVREPNPSSPSVPNAGDVLDALDIGFTTPPPSTGVLFSLDGAFSDPLENLPNSGSAMLTGFSGAMVLRSAGGLPTVYATAQELGLDRMGPGTDDLDALAVAENGDFVFTPSQVPFDWLDGAAAAGAPRDMLLFSVRRGSAVIGRPDSLFGAPIEEGDVLTTPLPPALGGMSPFPGIFLAAESLGLRTVRSGTAMMHGDDLDALDVAEKCFDCNGNGVEDAVDIATGASTDVNHNGIPDECEPPVIGHCFCTANVAPCGNADASAGCANSTGFGGLFGQTGGGTSVVSDDLVVTAIHLPHNRPALFFMGGGIGSFPFGDGVRCGVSGGMGVHRYAVQNTGPTGTMTLGPGIAGYSCSHFPSAGCIAPGDTWQFQAWYRDPIGPCGGTFNVSNALQVEFAP